MIEALPTLGDESSEDIALVTLLSIAGESAPDFPIDIVKRVYALQKRHQFDADRSASIQELQRLLEAQVDCVNSGSPV